MTRPACAQALRVRLALSLTLLLLAAQGCGGLTSGPAPAPTTSVRIEPATAAPTAAPTESMGGVPTGSPAAARAAISPPPTARPGPCPAPLRATGAPSYLQIAGARLLDESGRDVRMTGINWFGLETEALALQGLDQSRWCDLLDRVKAAGFNTLRLPFSDRIFDAAARPRGIDYTLNPDLQGLEGQGLLDRIVAGAGARQLKVILARQRPTRADGGLWYAAAYPEVAWIAHWEALARRYLGDDTVIGFELDAGPGDPACWGCGDPRLDWRLAAERAGDAVLAVNRRALIIVSGVSSFAGASYWPGGNLQGARDFPVRLALPGRVIYAAQDYGPEVAAQPWLGGTGFPQSMVTAWDANWGYISRLGLAPVMLSQFAGRSTGGDAAGIWQRTLVNYLRAGRMHYAYGAPAAIVGAEAGLSPGLAGAADDARLSLLRTYQSSVIKRPFMVSASTLNEALETLCWVAFAPTNQDPNNGIAPDEASLTADLAALAAAGFDGLVTYGAEDRIYRLAPKAGFRAMIMGIWDLGSMAEITAAETAGKDPFVMGFVVGNEGRDERYDDRALYEVMEYLRRATGKPATTTEQIEDYQDPVLLAMGDWVFPNAHPYWAGLREPQDAADWTLEQYQALVSRVGGRATMLKEVGLPTSGDPNVSEERQAEYYRLLVATTIRFAYFEAFDQPWKTWAPAEPFWGLYRSDRSPKLVVKSVCPANRP